jgi:hypothetical protein
MTEPRNIADQLAVEVCCDDASHPTKHVHIGRFVWSDDDRNLGWDLQPTEYETPAAGNYRAALQGDRVVKSDIDPGKPVRARSLLTCKLCGDTVPVRQEKVIPILDRLAEAGVDEISLAALAARL